jgi:EmrB/QacA subfamily drug resistance transporter
LTSAADLDPRTKRIVVAGALLGLLLAASNQTIISTALPTIVGDLGGLNLLSWVFTGYMLTSTTIVPITGKLSDIYGRKPFFMGGIVIFMLASVAGGFAGSMEQLIIVRAIQGIGGGMLMSCVFAIIGDLFAPEERGRYQGIFISMFGVASILGPTMGGTITDYVHWRGIFYINLPFGFAALAIIGATFPNLQRTAVKVSIDYAGVTVLSAMLVCLLLALAWGGDVYEWGSLEIIGLLAASGSLFALFLFVELTAKEPVIPLHLFKNRIFAVGSALTFLSGISMMGVITFMPLFLQGVLGASATSSGLVLSPMMLSVVLASNSAGYLVGRTNRYRSFVALGFAVLMAGTFLLSRFSADTTWPQAILAMVLVGSGIGFCVPVINLAVQNAFSRQYLGVATSSSQFFRQIGGTLGIAVFGTLLVTGISDNLNRNIPAEVNATAPPALAERLHDADVVLREEGRRGLESDFLAIGEEGARLYNAALVAIKSSVADALADIFFAAFLVAIASVSLSILMPERVHQAAAPAPSPDPPAPQPAPALEGGSALVQTQQRRSSLGLLALVGGGVALVLLARRILNGLHGPGLD